MIDKLVRENIVSLRPFSSARAEYEGDADILLDANENPFPTAYNRYPDPYQKKLKKEISKWRNVDPENIFLGNGSDEIIDILVRTFCEPKADRIRYVYPSFGMYEVVADINDVEKWPIHLNKQFDIDVEHALRDIDKSDKILFLCSPNNPTGNCLNYDSIHTIIENFPGIVVIDEAYIDFAESPSLIGSITERENLVILQTFSKALGAAGLRVGMSFANENIVRYLNKVKPPYNIGSIVQNNALEVLQQIKQLNQQIQLIKSERDELKNSLLDLEIIEHVFPSDANFLLVRFKGNPTVILEYLRDKGIVVRNRSKLPGCDRCLRLTIGTPLENKSLVQAIREYS